MGTAIALGKFDGIHLGHQLLIDGLLREKEKGRQACLMTAPYGWFFSQITDSPVITAINIYTACIYTRSGNVGLLKLLGEEYHFEVNALAKRTLHGKMVSSTVKSVYTITDILSTFFSLHHSFLPVHCLNILFQH